MRNAAWTLARIGDLFDIGAGKTMSAAARLGAQQRPFLRTSNVLWNEFDLSHVDRMSISVDEFEAKSLRRGDLLVCEGGDIGRAAVWQEKIDSISFQNHLHRLRARSVEVVPEFYAYFLQSAFTQLGLFEGAGNKTTIPNLSRNRLAALEVPSPDRIEHGDVVRVLDLVRAGIQLQQRAQALAGTLKRAALRELFTRGLRGEAQQPGPFGPIPAGWIVTNLRSLCSTPGGSIQTGPFGSQLHAHDYRATGTPVVNPTHMKDNRINHEGIPTVDDETVARLERHRLQVGDLLFARRGVIGRHALVGPSEGGWLCGTGCFVVRIRSAQVVPAFLNFLYSTEPSTTWLEGHAAGAIMPNLNNVVLGELPACLPPPDEQREIVEILDAIDQKIGLHKRKKAVLDELFKALLHKLMTGEIRVSDLDLSALERDPK